MSRISCVFSVLRSLDRFNDLLGAWVWLRAATRRRIASSTRLKTRRAGHATIDVSTIDNHRRRTPVPQRSLRLIVDFGDDGFVLDSQHAQCLQRLGDRRLVGGSTYRMQDADNHAISSSVYVRRPSNSTPNQPHQCSEERLGGRSCHRFGNRTRLKGASAHNRPLKDDQRVLSAGGKRSDGCVTIRAHKCEQIGFLDANRSSSQLTYSCLQDLETPLQRKFSTRALGIPVQRKLGLVAAVAPATSSTTLVDDFDDYVIHYGLLSLLPAR